MALRLAIASARNALEQAPGAPPGQAEDVRQTLGLRQDEPILGMPLPSPPTMSQARHAAVAPS